jgi:NDP-sugar pyrophosphorylase family protein
MKNIKALLLAAGKSTRIAPIAQGNPKPLLNLGGKSVLLRNLEWLSQSGIHDIWINLHHQPEKIKAHIGSQFKVHYIYEPELLGTAGAVKNLENLWTDTFLVVYGDNLIRFSLENFYCFHKQNRTIASIALFDREKHLHTGIAGGQVVLNQARIESFIEGVTKRLSPYVNAGAYFLEPPLLSHIPPQIHYDFGKELFPQLLAENIPLAGHVIDGYCLGIDTPESYYRALELLEQL